MIMAERLHAQSFGNKAEILSYGCSTLFTADRHHHRFVLRVFSLFTTQQVSSAK